MSRNELQRVVAEMRKRASYLLNLSNEQLRADGAALNGWASRIEVAQAVAPGGDDMQLRARIAGELIAARDTEDGCNRIMALLAAAPASEAKGQSPPPYVIGEEAEGFREWWRRNVPEGTVIGSPDWWAIRIQRFFKHKPAASSVDDVMQSFDDTWADDAEQEQAGEDYLRKFEADNARFVEALPRKLTWQADELPDRIWIPAAVVASYSRKPLPGDNPRVEFVRRAARVEKRISALLEDYRSCHPHATITYDGVVTALTAALEPGE